VECTPDDQATTTVASAPSTADDQAATTSSAGRCLQFGDLPVITRLGDHANGDALDESLIVDYEISDVSEHEEGEVVTTFGGTAEEWAAYEENLGRFAPVRLHELERNPSAAMVLIYRTEEEEEEARMNAAREREPVVVTNHETGLGQVPRVAQRPAYALPEMPPPSGWPAGNTPENLLAKARVRFEQFDVTFQVWRGSRLRDDSGVARAHPIPVLLFDGETEAEYEAAFLASIRKVGRDGTVREVATDPQGERSQRMQFAMRRMWEYRERAGVKPPACASTSRGRKRVTSEGQSPPPAPQRQQRGLARPQEGVWQAPMSSAPVRSLSTSPNSEVGRAVALRAAGTQRGSVPPRDYRSAAPVVLANAMPATGAQPSVPSSALDFVAQLVQQNSRAIGSLERELAAQRDRHEREYSALRLKYEELETLVHDQRVARAEEHRLAKTFHARYAPRVKALWKHQSVLDDHVGAEGDQRLGDWDSCPQ